MWEEIWTADFDGADLLGTHFVVGGEHSISQSKIKFGGCSKDLTGEFIGVETSSAAHSAFYCITSEAFFLSLGVFVHQNEETACWLAGRTGMHFVAGWSLTRRRKKIEGYAATAISPANGLKTKLYSHQSILIREINITHTTPNHHHHKSI